MGFTAVGLTMEVIGLGDEVGIVVNREQKR